MPVGAIGAETLAGLQPDVIVAVSAGLPEQDYDLFSRIASVISPPARYVDHGMPWPEATRLTGRAMGESVEAEELVGDLQARIEQVAAANPGRPGSRSPATGSTRRSAPSSTGCSTSPTSSR